ncbi:MAG: MBL fold metallo-hydrolase [Bacteroidetes bacterium]|uniref:MBL fold metallo-hydrolase n=1 Tax=Candidatus Cryptobacteroides intestinigallinarum TaxID=2840767 RepID=A0A9D9HJX3_9BACT|nr:MBL fold metallo-hydrolase [Candidatus Cryptobacteroides intestinigallinarum]
MVKIKTFYFNPLHECCSVVWDETLECVIIDPGFYTPEERDELLGFIRDNRLRPVKILLTHAHFDHVFGLKECAASLGVPVLMDPADKGTLASAGYFCTMFGLRTPDTSVETADIHDQDKIRFGNTELEVLSTPGHTPGGVCFYDKADKVLFSGDTLFAGAIGRTDHPGGDYDKLIEGIFSKLMVLDGDVTVIPGHGPQTTITDERTKNPFLQPFNEPYEEEDKK